MTEDRHAYLAQRAQSLLTTLTHEFVGSQGGGRLSVSAYETAWVAQVRHPDAPDRLAFPDALWWLLRRQQRDGSWGPAYPYAPLATLAATLALRSSPTVGTWVQHAIARADAYLQTILAKWDPEVVDTPFIEFLVPLLLDGLARVGLRYTLTRNAGLGQRAQAKLLHFPIATLYEGISPLVHALEALGGQIDFRRLRRQQPSFGGYGYSPSATAAALMRGPWNAQAATWLGQLSERRLDGLPGGMPSSQPSDVFETSWSLYYLQRGHLAPFSQQTSLLHWLREAVTDAGVSFGRVAAMPPDVDDTAMALIVSAQGGESLRLAALWPFAQGDHFVSYAHERTTSTSANAHVLEALAHAPPTDSVAAQWRAQVGAYLLAQQCQGWWRDKWHISRYYATDCCVQALVAAQTPESLPYLQMTADWLMRTQHADGGWGEGDSTIEETAYALLTLHTLGARDDAVRDGSAYLWRYRRPWRFDGATLPQLWVDKSLYAPPRVIEAAALAALQVTTEDAAL